MSIIDLRIRPVVGDFKGFLPGLERSNAFFGYGPVDPSALHQSVEELVQELDAADVVKAVLPGRGRAVNKDLQEIAEKYPEKFIFYPYIDVTNPEQALKDIDDLVINGPGQGVAIEPYGFGPVESWPFDDERINPIYKKLQDNNIPVFGTVSGWVGPYTDNTLPAQIDRLLTKFPKLTFVAIHSAWPWFNEIFPIAFKHPNLYLNVDFESLGGVTTDTFKLGASRLPDQIVLASGYPIGSVAQSIEKFKAWNLGEEINQKILYSNAAKILGLE